MWQYTVREAHEALEAWRQDEHRSIREYIVISSAT
jgi:hypothetical protein